MKAPAHAIYCHLSVLLQYRDRPTFSRFRHAHPATSVYWGVAAESRDSDAPTWKRAVPPSWAALISTVWPVRSQPTQFPLSYRNIHSGRGVIWAIFLPDWPTIHSEAPVSILW